MSLYYFMSANNNFVKERFYFVDMPEWCYLLQIPTKK